jgi:hypothetical protein
VKQHQRQPDAEEELQHQRQHVKCERHPQPVPELAVGDELGIVGDAGKRLLAGRRKALE